jgi:hypothetical protein
MTAPIRRHGISVQRIGDETVLHDAERQQAHVVNQSAAWVWEHFDGIRSTDDIADQLAREFEIPVEAARSDVSAVTDAFRRLGLLG